MIWALVLLPQLTNASEISPKLKPISVQVNWNHQFEFAGFYAAIQQGYYQKAGFDVEVRAWKPGVSAVDDVITGRVDYATGYSSLVADFAKGVPIKLVMASFQFSPMILLSHEPVLGLEQLSGKKVMHYGNMQVKALISKAKNVVSTPVVEIQSSGNLQDFIDKKVDFYSAYNTNEPSRLRQAGIPFYTLDPKTYGIQAYGDLLFTSQKNAENNPIEVAKFRDATIEGWKYAINHQEEVVDFILANYPVVKDREALLEEAKATKIYVQPGNAEIGKVQQQKLMASAVDARDTGLMTHEEFNGLEIQRFIFDQTNTVFSKEELEYLRNNPVIKIGNDSFWEPFEFIDEKGEYKGIAADYFALFSKQLGVKFEPANKLIWSDVVEKVKQGEIPVYSCAVPTEDRQKYMNFTQPYLSFPLVLASRKQLNFVDNYAQLNGQTVAVVKGYWSHEWLLRNYPKINLLVVDSIQEGLESVLSNKAIAYAGNLAAINFAIKRYGFDGLHMISDSNARFELSIGVDKNDPVLFSILSKALESVSTEQKNRIYNDWIQLELLQKTDRSTLIKIILIALLIGVLLFAILMFFYQQKRKQKSYIDQVNNLSLATYTDIKTKEIQWVSYHFLDLIGCSKEDVLYQSHDVLRHPDVDDEFYDTIHNTIASGEVWSGELQGQCECGKPYWVEATGTPEFHNGEVVGIWTTRVDITDKKRLEELAIKDSLTGLYNRNYFGEIFDSQVTKSGRQKKSFSIAMLDIDYFKKINDLYGHQKGDEVLKQVSRIVKQHFHRSNDLLFRVGGEEFVILSDFDSLEQFSFYLEQLRAKIEKLNLANPDSELKVVTISIGGVFCQNAENATSDQLYSFVDKLLYESKSQGRNRVVMNGAEDICGKCSVEGCLKVV